MNVLDNNLPATAKTKRIIVPIIVTAIIGIGLLACLTPIWTYETLYLRHRRANQLWVQRQPYHYSYEIKLSSWHMYLNYYIEVLDGQILSVRDARTNNEVIMTPISGQTNWTGFQVRATHLLINDLFGHIRMGTVTPHSVKELVGRSNYEIYTRLATAGLVKDGWLACQPAYPQVRYNKVYGYPEELLLYGEPCSNNIEQNAAIKIKIEAFQVLP